MTEKITLVIMPFSDMQKCPKKKKWQSFQAILKKWPKYLGKKNNSGWQKNNSNVTRTVKANPIRLVYYILMTGFFKGFYGPDSGP